MPSIREALENPELLTDKGLGRFITYGLLNTDKSITELGSKLLLKDEEAYNILKSRIDDEWRMLDCIPEWVTSPVYKEYPRVFGYGYK